MYATCFGLYLSSLQACHCKNLTEEDSNPLNSNKPVCARLNKCSLFSNHHIGMASIKILTTVCHLHTLLAL